MALIRSGFEIALVLMDTLSAPALRSKSTSSTLLIPPPTVRGTKTASAVFLTTSIIVFLSSLDAEISRKVISSAPFSA